MHVSLTGGKGHTTTKIQTAPPITTMAKDIPAMTRVEFEEVTATVRQSIGACNVIFGSRRRNAALSHRRTLLDSVYVLTVVP